MVIGCTSRVQVDRWWGVSLSQALLGYWEHEGHLNSGLKIQAAPAKERPLEARCGVQERDGRQEELEG